MPIHEPEIETTIALISLVRDIGKELSRMSRTKGRTLEELEVFAHLSKFLDERLEDISGLPRTPSTNPEEQTR